MVVNLHQVNAGSNPAFHFKMRVWILLLIKVMRICDPNGLQTLKRSILSLHASTVSVHGSILSLESS
jgi:hypothetical protein